MNYENSVYPSIQEEDFVFPSKEDINSICIPMSEITKNEDILDYLPKMNNVYSKRVVKRCKKQRKREYKFAKKNSMGPPPPKPRTHPYFLYPESELFPLQQMVDPNRRYDNIEHEKRNFDFSEVRTRTAFRLEHDAPFKPFYNKSEKKKKKKKKKMEDEGEPVTTDFKLTIKPSSK